MATVTLDCTICPKKPVFSDLSHLLTHLASKGHLSHYFKAQVKSQQDADVLAELQIFDKWYSDNRMGQLLHDRMAQKEKRKTTTRVKQPAIKATSGKSVSVKSEISSERVKMHCESMQEAIDPRLTGLSGTDGYACLASHIHCPQSHDLRQPFEADRQSNFGDHRLAESVLNQGSLTFMHPNLLKGYPLLYTSTDYQKSISEPQMSAPVGLLSPLPSSTSLSRSTEDARIGSYEIHTSIESDPDPVPETSEYATLKGVIWPGMDLFDSASPHAKRIRNQKKDSSCLEQMRSYAETIEPNEDIYYFPSWELKQSREITGQVESSSPEGKDPTPRVQKKRGRNKRTRPGRAPLSTLDSNQLPTKRSTDRLPEIACRPRKPVGFSDVTAPMPMPPTCYTHGSRNIGNQWPSFLDDELEWQMTYGIGRQFDNKNSIPIFRDTQHRESVGMNVRRSPSRRQDENDLLSTPSHRPRPRAARKIPTASNAVNNRFNHTNNVSIEQQLRAASCGLSKIQEGQENRPSSLDPYISEFDNKSVPLFPSFQPRKGFGLSEISVPSDNMRRRLPFADFIDGYQNFAMPVMTPGKGDMKVENNPLSIFPSGSNQQSPSKLGPSPASVNPLLDFSGLFNQSNMRESDDETIDDGIGEGEN